MGKVSPYKNREFKYSMSEIEKACGELYDYHMSTLKDDVLQRYFICSILISETCIRRRRRDLTHISCLYPERDCRYCEVAEKKYNIKKK